MISEARLQWPGISFALSSSHYACLLAAGSEKAPPYRSRLIKRLIGGCRETAFPLALKNQMQIRGEWMSVHGAKQPFVGKQHLVTACLAKFSVIRRKIPVLRKIFPVNFRREFHEKRLQRSRFLLRN
jgi:hypothetical protein